MKQSSSSERSSLS